MDLDNFLASLPDYAKDLRINLGNVLRQTELSEQQTWGTAVCCAMTVRQPALIAVIEEEAARHLDGKALFAAKAAAALMGMNNVFYRFRHLVGNPEYADHPARLRMQAIRSHGSDPLDFELWCLAASAVTGCGACMAAHEKTLREKGARAETVAAAVRIAAVIHGLAVALAEAGQPVLSVPVPAGSH
jgi:alkyl hydroperoxide reductase subunit D